MMYTLDSPQARRIALAWSATLLLLSGVGLYAAALEPATRQQLIELVRVLALGSADSNVTAPVPTLDSPAPLRTH